MESNFNIATLTTAACLVLPVLSSGTLSVHSFRHRRRNAKCDFVPFTVAAVGSADFENARFVLEQANHGTWMDLPNLGQLGWGEVLFNDGLRFHKLHLCQESSDAVSEIISGMP